MVKAACGRLLTAQRLGLDRSDRMMSVVKKVALGKSLPEYFGFLCPYNSTNAPYSSLSTLFYYHDQSVNVCFPSKLKVYPEIWEH